MWWVVLGQLWSPLKLQGGLGCFSWRDAIQGATV
jgi:hypothetical protein